MIEIKEIYTMKDSWDYRESLEIEVYEDEEYIRGLDFFDGEPEDNNICRNFSDVHSIVDLVRYAYEAGKRGELMVFTYDDRSDEEE